MTYALCKKLILKGNCDKDELLNKLDVFLLANRITQAQYEELSGMLKEE